MFALVFGALGGVAARECRKRGLGRGVAILVGLPLFLGPLGLLHGSSLGGFYEARASGPHLLLRYLSPLCAERLAWPDLTRVEASPAFRGRWRLHLTLASGGELESATADAEAVETAARLLRARVDAAGRGEPR